MTAELLVAGCVYRKYQAAQAAQTTASPPAAITIVGFFIVVFGPGKGSPRAGTLG